MAERFGKLAAGIHRNPKVRAAGRLGREVWFWAICVNADGDYDGRIPQGYLGAAHMARELDMTAEESSDGLDACIEAGLLEHDGKHFVMLGWGPEWGSAKSTPRVQAFRKRQGKAANSETGGSVSRNNETQETHIRRDQKRREEILPLAEASGVRALEEEKKSPPLPSKSSRPRRRKSELPSSWVPNELHKATATRDRVDVAREAERFRNHAAASGRTCVDWDAAFRNWLIKASELTGPATPESQGPGPGVEQW